MRSRASKLRAKQLLQALLGTVIHVLAGSCPGLKLQCLVLSVRDLCSGKADPEGWLVDTAWRQDLIARQVRMWFLFARNLALLLTRSLLACLCVTCRARSRARSRRRCSL
jgi:hypothetical protein